MTKRLGLLALAALVGAGMPGAARADKLDNRLNKEMPSIIKELKAKGYHNVGVLRFPVQQGTRKPSFTTPLSGSLPTRIENLLVIHGGPTEADALGVIHDAGPVALKNKVASWSESSDNRKKLFGISYPLAWGHKEVKPDVFLTGLVQTSRDLRKTTVTLQYFDRTSSDLAKLTTFTIDSDRNILRDLGYSFSLNSQARSKLVAKRSTSGETDELVFVQLPRDKGDLKDDEDKDDADNKKDDDKKADEKKSDEKKPARKKPAFKRPSSKRPVAKKSDDKDSDDKKSDDKKGDTKKSDTPALPSSVGGIQVEMLVDGKPVDFREASTEGDAIRWQIESPAPGQKVAFRLTNNAAQKLGVVLKLNGVNTVNQQKDDPERCQKWVIDPGKTYVVKGFYMITGRDEGTASERGKRAVARRGSEEDEGEKETPRAKPANGKSVKPQVFPFAILVGAEAKAAKEEMADKVGLIEVDVFEVGTEVADAEAMVVSKGVPPSKEKKARESYVSLRSALIKSARLKTTVVASREVIVPDKTVATEVGGPIKLVSFDNPQFVSRVAIRIVPGDAKPE